STRERQDYRERSVILSASQLVGPDLSFGCSYRLSEAHLHRQLIDVPASAGVFDLTRDEQLEALLHEVRLFGIFNHSSGFFTQADATWRTQHSEGYQTDLPSDAFWQVDVFAGYRFLRRHAEARVGILNVTGQDYR